MSVLKEKGREEKFSPSRSSLADGIRCPVPLSTKWSQFAPASEGAGSALAGAVRMHFITAAPVRNKNNNNNSFKNLLKLCYALNRKHMGRRKTPSMEKPM